MGNPWNLRFVSWGLVEHFQLQMENTPGKTNMANGNLNQFEDVSNFHEFPIQIYIYIYIYVYILDIIFYIYIYICGFSICHVGSLEGTRFTGGPSRFTYFSGTKDLVVVLVVIAFSTQTSSSSNLRSYLKVAQV